MKTMRATFLLVFFLTAIHLSASESFTLSIPLRFNSQQETGEVRVTLTLSAASAGAQLVVSGGTTLNLGDTATVAGDSVSFTALTGNDVRITYRPLSNFGTDFCDGGSATPKDVPMRFVGAQDVTDYRVSTYIVAAPNAECSQVSKHTGDSPATLVPVDDGVAPALVANDRGRHPFDVVLVLDKSGSMSGLPPGANAGANKATILISAVDAFVSAWDQIDAPSGTGEWSHDRIGVVFFDSAAVAQSIPGADPPANFFVQRGSGWQPVINTVNTLSPGSSTSIGGGLNEGMKQWKSDPANDLSVVVVTDGMQNTAPLIQATASGFLGLTPVSGLPQELRQRFIPIQTIGFGQPATVDEELLRNISLETAGVSYIALNATTMFDVFAMTLVAILKGNTVSLATNAHGTMSGAGPTAAQTVFVDRSAERVVFLLQWAPPLGSALDLEVFPPGSTKPAKPTSNAKTPQASLQTFDVKEADAGKWKVRVKRADSGADVAVPYTLNVLFLERHLDYRLTLDKLHTATGDRLGIRAELAWDGKPLKGLPAGALQMRVQRPTRGLGTVLHESRAKGDVIMPAGDAFTPQDRKIAALARRGLLETIRAADFATITLKEQRDGVYTATFPDTSIPGSYAFNAVLDWDDPHTGRVHREERLETYVKAKADASKTEIKTTRMNSSTVRFSVTPRDRFGNYVGPGYDVKATLKGAGKLSGPIDAASTGTYIFTVSDLPRRETPKITVTVDGVPVAPR